MRSRARIWMALSLLVSSCVATPLPDPPDLRPPDLSRMDASPNQGILGPTVTIMANADAVVPGSIVRVVPLGSMEPFVEALSADGSFEVTVNAATGTELRITSRTDEARSVPMDVIVPVSRGRFAGVTRDPCVVLEPAIDLGEVAPGSSSSALLTVTNDCAAAITLATSARIESSISIDPPPTATLEVGSSVDLEVRFAPSAAGYYEEVVFVNVGGAIAERYPVTAFGISR